MDCYIQGVRYLYHNISRQKYLDIYPVAMLRSFYINNKTREKSKTYRPKPAASPLKISWSPGFGPESAYCQNVVKLVVRW
jgi:hypothetical protein